MDANYQDSFCWFCQLLQADDLDCSFQISHIHTPEVCYQRKQYTELLQ